MTRTVWADDQVQAIKPEFVAPLVTALCSEKPPIAAQLFEAGSGHYTCTRWQRSRGVDFEHEKGVPEVEEVAKVKYILFFDNVIILILVQAFNEIINFENGQADNPDTPADGSKYTMGNVMKNPKLVSVSSARKLELSADILHRKQAWKQRIDLTASI